MTDFGCLSYHRHLGSPRMATIIMILSYIQCRLAWGIPPAFTFGMNNYIDYNSMDVNKIKLLILLLFGIHIFISHHTNQVIVVYQKNK